MQAEFQVIISFNENCLKSRKRKINNLITLSGQLSAQDYHELMFYYELKERLTICLTLIEHLKARKETRWHSFAENLDHPQKSDDWKNTSIQRKWKERSKSSYEN